MRRYQGLFLALFFTLTLTKAFAGKTIDIILSDGKNGGKIEQVKTNLFYFFDTNGQQFAYANYKPVKSYIKQDKDTIVNSKVEPFSYFSNSHTKLGYVRVVNGIWYLYSLEWRLLGSTNDHFNL